MAGLIEEIQRDSLNPSVPVDTLLRKVKLAAAKLKLNSLEAWVENELNGYSSELPAYRIVQGHPAAWNPYNGWIPIHIGDEDVMDMISEARIRQSIAGLQDLVDRDSDGSIHLPIPSGLVEELSKILDYQTPRMTIQLSRGHVISIITSVRNLVLDWAIEMERQGVKGDGFSFNDNEREQAKQVMTNFTVGNIGTFVGNLGSDNTTGDISVTVSSATQILDAVAKIKDSFADLEAAGVDRPRLARTIDAIQEEAGKPSPSGGRLKSLLTDAREAMVGAAGNLTAEGALSLIGAALKLLGGS